MRMTLMLALLVCSVGCCSDSDEAAELSASLRGMEDALAEAEQGDYYYIQPSWGGEVRPYPDDGIPARVISDAVPAPTFFYMKHFNLAMNRLARIRGPRLMPANRPASHEPPQDELSYTRAKHGVRVYSHPRTSEPPLLSLVARDEGGKPSARPILIVWGNGDVRWEDRGNTRWVRLEAESIQKLASDVEAIGASYAGRVTEHLAPFHFPYYELYLHPRDNEVVYLSDHLFSVDGTGDIVGAVGAVQRIDEVPHPSRQLTYNFWAEIISRVQRELFLETMGEAVMP